MLARREAFHDRLFTHFREAAIDQQIPPDKRKPKSFEYDGLHWGEQALEMYQAWVFHEHNTPAVFGVPWIELPLTLQQDLLVLMKMSDWHKANLKAPDPSKVEETYNPFSE